MSHMGGYALRLSFIWPYSKSMHRHGLGNLVFPTAQYLCHRSGNHPLCTPMREGPPGGGPSLTSSSRRVLEIPAACDDVLLVNGRRHELETIPPHDGLDVVRVRPKGVEKVVGASGDVRIIAEEASTEAVTCVDMLSVHGVRAPAQVADDVVEPRVVYVGPKKITRYATNRRGRPGKAHLPRRNRGASVSGEINVAICGYRCGWEHVLDRTKWRWSIKRGAIAAVTCLAATWLRRWLRDWIARGSPAARSEHRRGIGPCLPGIG